MEPERNPGAKQPMTDEERLKLAKKLDDELDEYINSLPKTKYEDGWPEDRWEEVVLFLFEGLRQFFFVFFLLTFCL